MEFLREYWMYIAYVGIGLAVMLIYDAILWYCYTVPIQRPTAFLDICIHIAIVTMWPIMFIFLALLIIIASIVDSISKMFRRHR